MGLQWPYKQQSAPRLGSRGNWHLTSGLNWVAEIGGNDSEHFLQLSPANIYLLGNKFAAENDVLVIYDDIVKIGKLIKWVKRYGKD